MDKLGRGARLRKPTKKGLEYRLETLRSEAHRLFGRLDKLMSEVRDLISMPGSEPLVKEKYKSWLKLFDRFSTADHDYTALIGGLRSKALLGARFFC